jgi:rubredoxin-NAD+ reductase
LSAIGLKADTALAQAAGLAVDRAILVNRHLETSAAGVYALGDSAQYASAASPLSAHGSTLPYVMPIMAAAKALAANLTGLPTDLVFPLMPVSVKTPALPLVVAPPKPGTGGQWTAPESGLWQWLDDAGLQRGFVLAGAQTSQRMAQSRRVTL